jgi:predicted TIM-barrel fold metal-dependent hydrolase
MHQTLGIQRGVIVQATTYGSDHQAVLDALEALNSGPGPRRYLGCANALVLKEGSERYLQSLHDAGVRGARFTNGRFGISFSPSELQAAVDLIRELGWYIKIQPERDGHVPASDIFASVKLDVPVLIDHMGRIDPARGPDDPAFAYTCSLLERDNFWVMFSLSEKLSRIGRPWSDLVPYAERFLDIAPGRCVWGSDWPHPLTTTEAPNEGDLVDLLFSYADPAVIHKVLVDNPAVFFGFDQASSCDE